MVLYLNANGQACSRSFFRLDSGREPARDWLKGLSRENLRSIGEDIKTLQYGWPVGMPLARKMADDLWELRSNISSGIARTFFTVYDRKIVLLHGFVKRREKLRRRNQRLRKED